MKMMHWVLGAACWGLACSGGEAAPAGRRLPAADAFGVRVAGGESADFGNGSDDVCGTSSVDTSVTQEQAEQAGLDVEADRAWLEMPHLAALGWNPIECGFDAGLCQATQLELRAELVEPILVQGRSQRPSATCPAEWQAFAYRAAVSVLSEDGKLAGTFYARVTRGSAGGVSTVSGHALPDLRNFDGTLPLEVDLTRPHFAYLDLQFSLASDGSASGKLEPSASYYDDAPQSERIGPDAAFAPDLANAAALDGTAVLAGSGASSTLSSYPGSSSEPLVALRVRTDAVEPSVNVEVTIWVDGEKVHDGSVAAGTSVELGRHAFGTPVTVDVHNANGAGLVRANILQDNCFVASSSCSSPDCTAHAEYTAAHQLCFN